MKGYEVIKKYTLKSGAEYIIFEQMHYTQWGYWTWKQIFFPAEDKSIVISDTYGYYYDVYHKYADGTCEDRVIKNR